VAAASSRRLRDLHGNTRPGSVALGGVAGCRAGAVLSYQTAAELHGLSDKPTSPIHVTIPAQRHLVAVSGVCLHRSGRAVEAVLGGSQPPRTRVEETVLDLTQAARTFDDMCGWVTRAIARELTDETRLNAAMSARRRLRVRT
jgi:predicted transcriptional regulator of viral defense system